MFSKRVYISPLIKTSYRPLSVNSQSGGQNNKIVLHLKGLFLSGDRKTIVLSSRLGITEMGLFMYADDHQLFSAVKKTNDAECFF